LKFAPIYLKLYEEVIDTFLIPFLRILSRISPRAPNYNNLRVRNKIEAIESSCLSVLVRNCNPTIRNAIGHGGVTFDFFDIIFRDDHGNEERISESTFSRLINAFIDDLYGVALAIELYAV
ncbi:unnamed protein product, partial [marine sediment metagenome]